MKKTQQTPKTTPKKTPKGKYAWTATVGEKGQIVIPKEARDIFNINPGDTIILLGDEKKGIAIPPSNMFTDLMTRIFPGSDDN
ncbi:MAG: AbrB/MazE/SpoVT family DNA-binding domain-containing protein [Treponema sp.]|nr:AbrB/MazE/SpoVT family DNA-binding domain-containing protein [Treponema sp.]